MPLKLLEDRIAVIADEDEEATASGLIVAPEFQNPYVHGTVHFVGVGRRSEAGELVEMDVSEGDRAIFHRHAGFPLKVGSIEYRVLRAPDLVAVVSDAP